MSADTPWSGRPNDRGRERPECAGAYHLYTSFSGSAKFPGWESWKTLVSVTAYHSFAGEVEALNTPTIRRLTPSCRHQLPPIALCAAARKRALKSSLWRGLVSGC